MLNPYLIYTLHFAKYVEYGWTKTHGYFIQMGGFMLYVLELIHYQVGNRDSHSTYIQTVYIPRINIHTSSNLL